MRWSWLLAGIVLPVMMAGCADTQGGSTDLQELELTKPTGSPFTRALSHEYAAFAQAEAERQQWAATAHFAKKGLAAAHGAAVPPEGPAERSAGDPPAAQDLAAARNRLLSVLASDAPARAPALTATAQVKFDCWVQHQAEGGYLAATGACRKNFLAAMDALEALVKRSAQPANPPAPASSARKPPDR